MFGISFWELLLIGLVALIVVGPDKLPQMLGTLGRWSNKLRRLTTEARQQTGIDDLLRQNGIAGGLDEIRELRQIVRGNITGLAGSAVARGGSASARPASSSNAPQTSAGTASSQPPKPQEVDPYAAIPSDRSREYPEEGCDAYGCLPDDLWVDHDKEALADEMIAMEDRASSSESPEAGPETLPIEAEAAQADTDRQPASRPLVETQPENAELATSPSVEDSSAPVATATAPEAEDQNHNATTAAAQPSAPDDPSRV